MKVVHIESGLGNQMLSYCEYLALKKANPHDDIFIETIIYDVPECNDVICQWNGYELGRIFHVDVPNVRDVISDEKWSTMLSEITKSEFWNKNWNYPVYFTNAFQKIGIQVENMRGDFEAPGSNLMTSESHSLKSRIRHTRTGYMIKSAIDRANSRKLLENLSQEKQTFISTDADIFTGQRLAFKLLNNGIERIECDIRKTFVFPDIIDDKNRSMMQIIKNSNSVAIHARRGDMLGYNSDCYKYGYFKRSVKYIRRHVSSPVFVFFCDPGSIEWCRENEKIFGLKFSEDQVYFVDWNQNSDYYRDMQLMAACKHQIITNSSFGWWGAFLNNNPSKITCSPDIRINTTHHF